MIYLSCLVCQPCLLGLDKGSGLFISVLVRNQPQGSFACFFCSLDSSFQVTVLHRSTSNSTFPVVQTRHELSNAFAWTLIIVKRFVFSHHGHYLSCAIPEEAPSLFSWVDMACCWAPWCRIIVFTAFQFLNVHVEFEGCRQAELLCSQ